MGFINKLKEAVGYEVEDDEEYIEEDGELMSAQAKKNGEPVKCRAAIIIYDLEAATMDDQMKLVVEDVKSGKIAILNIGSMGKESAQRFLDFISGASFAIGGTFTDLSETLFLFIPKSISITNSKPVAVPKQ